MANKEKVMNSILNSLRAAQRGKTVTEISREIGLNRNSCAKYLEILNVNGQVEMKEMGRAKVYFISQRVPISALLDFSSDLIIVLDNGLNIIDVNDNLLTMFNFKKEMLLDNKINNTSIPFFNEKGDIRRLKSAVKGKESTFETGIEMENGQKYFKLRLIPSTLGDGRNGVTVIMENITDQTIARKELKESEERYRELITNQGEGVGITDIEDRFIFANPAAEKLMGVKEGGLIGRIVKDFVDPEEHEMVDRFSRRRSKGKKDSYVISIISEDGLRKKVLLTVTARFSEEGDFIGSFGVFRDVTRIFENEERFRTLFNSSPDGIMIMRGETFVYCNNSALKIFNATDFHDINGLKPLDLSPKVQPDGTKTEELQERYIRETMKKGSKDFEWMHRRLNGEDFQAFVRLNRVKIGGETFLQATVRDITELRSAQSEVRQKDSRIMNIMRSLHGSFIGLLRRDTIFEEFWGTKELDEKYGVDSSSIPVGMSILDFILDEDKDDLSERIEKCFETGKPFKIEHRASMQKGLFWQEWAFSPYMGQEGDIEYLVLFGRDTQEKNEILRSLSSSRERLSNILSSLYNSYIGLINREHVFEDFWGSKELDERYGLRSSDVIGMNITNFAPEGHEGELIALVDSIFRTGESLTIEVPGVLPGGSFWQVMTFSPFLNSSGEIEYVIMYGMDSTEKHDLFHKLKEIEERYKLLDENSSDVIWMADNKMQYTYLSSSSMDLTGYTLEELIGKDIMGIISSSSLEKVDQRFSVLIKDFLMGKPNQYDNISLELDIKRKDGSTLPCELNIDVIQDKYGKPRGLIGITRDISERKSSWRTLERRERILEAMDRITNDLLRNNIEEGSIGRSLKLLGEVMDVSRVYVFRNQRKEDDRLLTSQVLEWAKYGIDPQIDNPVLQDFDLREGGFERWIDRMSKGEVINDIVKDIDEGEKAILDRQGIRSILVTPIFKDGEWWGFMGLDDCEKERDWSKAELRTLSSVSRIIAFALDK